MIEYHEHPQRQKNQTLDVTRVWGINIVPDDSKIEVSVLRPLDYPYK